MKKQLLLACLLVSMSFAANAQYDLSITYDANSGVSTLQGATKVYMHSGGNDGWSHGHYMLDVHSRQLGCR
ncbi:MAG: hypothetical protein IPN88_03435 [Bacteroidetes bacterium]|nr:hypothetical protein [Bacteroidota bacterium]